MQVLKPVNTYFSTALRFQKYIMKKKSQEHNSYISRKIVKCAKHLNVPINSVLIEPLVTIFTLSFLQNFKSEGDCNVIPYSAAMFLLHILLANLSRQLCHIVCVLTSMRTTKKEVSELSFVRCLTTCSRHMRPNISLPKLDVEL